MKLKYLPVFMLLATLMLAGMGQTLQISAADNSVQSSCPVYLTLWGDDNPGVEIIASNVSDIKDQEYTGKEIRPDVRVLESGEPLTEGTDYTCIYRNNVDIGKASVTIVGTGKYTGSVTKEFNIIKGTLSVKAEDYNGIFDGKPHSINVTVKPKDAEITYSTSEDGPFTSTIPERKNAGKTTVYYKVSLDNYKTEKGSAQISISKRNLELETVTVKETGPFTYSGAEIKPEVDISGPEAAENCNLKYRNNINTGTGIIEAVAKENGNYEGSIKTNFSIDVLNIADTDIKLSQSTFEYDGNAKKPDIDAGKLTDKDFTVSYKDNKNAGTATVIITGLPYNCTGTKTLTFTIKPADISKKTLNLSAQTFAYDGKVKTPTASIAGLSAGIDYTVTYAAGRKTVGTYAVTAKGKENCTGTKTASFKINPPATKITSLSAGSKRFKVKWSKKSSQVTGYQIMYSKSQNFSSYKTVKIKSYKTTSKTVKKLTAKKKYYVKIRTYKGSYYSNWSAVKAITTKK